MLAGLGGNGGGGLVAARHLINRDRDVRVLLAGPQKDLAPVPAHQLDILRRMSATVIDSAINPDLAGEDLIIDALLGYSLAGLYLADISVPRAFYHRMGLDVGSLFAEDSIVLLGANRRSTACWTPARRPAGSSDCSSRTTRRCRTPSAGRTRR